MRLLRGREGGIIDIRISRGKWGLKSGNVPAHCDAKGTGGLNQVLLGPLTREFFDAEAIRTWASEGAQCGAALGPGYCPRDSGIWVHAFCPLRKCTWLWVGLGKGHIQGAWGETGEIKTNKLGGKTSDNFLSNKLVTWCMNIICLQRLWHNDNITISRTWESYYL